MSRPKDHKDCPQAPAMGGRATTLLACALVAIGFMLATTTQRGSRLELGAVKQQDLHIQPLGTSPVSAAPKADFAPNALALRRYSRSWPPSSTLSPQSAVQKAATTTCCAS